MSGGPKKKERRQLPRAPRSPSLPPDDLWDHPGHRGSSSAISTTSQLEALFLWRPVDEPATPTSRPAVDTPRPQCQPAVFATYSHGCRKRRACSLCPTAYAGKEKKGGWEMKKRRKKGWTYLNVPDAKWRTRSLAHSLDVRSHARSSVARRWLCRPLADRSKSHPRGSMYATLVDIAWRLKAVDWSWAGAMGKEKCSRKMVWMGV